jgi:hypothetical protein
MKALTLILAVFLGSLTGYAAETVPFHASIDTSVAQVGFCGPTCVMLNISGSGVGSHVGRVDMEGPSQINFATLQQSGTSSFTAADGSTIDISFAGTFVPGQAPGDATFQGTWTVTGGTRRFADADGGGTYHGSASGDSGVLHLDGRISRPGKG